MFTIDVPQIAYRTWVIRCCVVDDDGHPDHLAEDEMEADLRESLSRSGFAYSEKHDHIA